MTMRIVAGLVLALIAGPAAAQVAAPIETGAPDPARLAAAREVVDLAYPPATRRAMFAGVQSAMAPMITRAIDTNPQLKQAFASDPRVKPIFDRFIAKVQARSLTMIDVNLPALFDAFGRAYARRFTLGQLADLKTFFATPTGQIFTPRALSLLSDPDVVAANQRMMAGQMNNMQGDIQAFAAEIKALPPLKPKG